MINKKVIKAFIHATKLRAKAYAYFYEELVKELDHEKAHELCCRVTYRLGWDKAFEFPKESKYFALNIAKFFIADPVGRAVFNQRIVSGNECESIIEMKNCPLVDMWKAMNLPDKMVCTLCDFAHKIDYGTIEGVGFRLEFKGRIACGNESCLLRIYK